MAFDMEGLADFGTGAFSGGTVGAKVSGGNPYATAGGAVLGGALSFFGGADQRKTEKAFNKKSLAQMDQDLELGDLNIAETRRKRAEEIARKEQMKRFGQMLGDYFKKKGVG